MSISTERGSLLAESFELRRVMPEQIAGQWPVLEKLLLEHPSLWNQLLTLETIEQHLASGGFQLWIVYIDDKHYVFAMSQMIIYPACRVLKFFWASGHGLEDHFWALAESMNAVALDLGCTHTEMEVGRKGWEPRMRQFGYELSRQILRKEVTQYRRQ